MAKITTPERAFIIKIQALYDIEKQLEKALPKLARASTDKELKKGFVAHLAETKMHSKRLEKIFKLIGMKPRKTICEGIRGIVEDGTWVMKVEAPSELKDSMIAGAARYAEHYEMAGYLGAIEEAQALGLSEAATLLAATLREEEGADRKLTGAMRKKLATA
jgi:ferritin-like metal-binding protein YciE